MHVSDKKGGGVFTAAHTCTGHICQCPPPPPGMVTLYISLLTWECNVFSLLPFLLANVPMNLHLFR